MCRRRYPLLSSHARRPSLYPHGDPRGQRRGRRRLPNRPSDNGGDRRQSRARFGLRLAALDGGGARDRGSARRPCACPTSRAFQCQIVLTCDSRFLLPEVAGPHPDRRGRSRLRALELTAAAPREVQPMSSARTISRSRPHPRDVGSGGRPAPVGITVYSSPLPGRPPTRAPRT